MKNLKVEQMAAARWFVHFETEQGKKITVEFIKSVSPEKLTKNNLMYLWVASGKLPAALTSWWTVSTYAYDDFGVCHGWYNPQVIDYERTNKRGKITERRQILNFEWIIEANAQNAKKILNEIERRANIDLKTVKDWQTIS